MKTVTTQNEFDFIDAVAATTTTESRKLEHTSMLISQADGKALELMRAVATFDDTDKMTFKTNLEEGNVADMFDWFEKTFTIEAIEADSKFLNTAEAEELGKLLESRRSDRSKLKKKKPHTSYAVCQKYLSAIYAEMLVRLAMGKPYNSTTSTENDLDIEDLDAIKRRVKSLQSKKCRLNDLAKYDDTAKAELADVVAEIARLNGLKPSTSTKVTVKSLDAETIRQALSQLNVAELDAETLGKLKVAGLI